MISDPKALAISIVKMYGAEAEQEARKYAEMLKERGRREYAIWIEAADIVARRQKLMRGLDA